MPEAELVALVTERGFDQVRVLSRGRNARTAAKETQVSVIEAWRESARAR